VIAQGVVVHVVLEIAALDARAVERADRSAVLLSDGPDDLKGPERVTAVPVVDDEAVLERENGGVDLGVGERADPGVLPGARSGVAGAVAVPIQRDRVVDAHEVVRDQADRGGRAGLAQDAAVDDHIVVGSDC